MKCLNFLFARHIFCVNLCSYLSSHWFDVDIRFSFIDSSGSVVTNTLDLSVPEDIIVQSGGLKLSKFRDLFVYHKVVPQIVLILDGVNPDFHCVFEDIFQGLEVHFQGVKFIFELFDLFFIDIALVHEPIFMLFIQLLLFHCHLVDLNLIKNYCILLKRPFVDKRCQQGLLFLDQLLVGEDVLRDPFVNESLQFVV